MREDSAVAGSAVVLAASQRARGSEWVATRGEGRTGYHFMHVRFVTPTVVRRNATWLNALPPRS